MCWPNTVTAFQKKKLNFMYFIYTELFFFPIKANRSKLYIVNAVKRYLDIVGVAPYSCVMQESSMIKL